MDRSEKKRLEEIREKESFDSLESYKDPKVWESLNVEEKELLGLLFAMHGDKQLQKGDIDADESFEMALRVSPKSARVLYRKAHALAKHEDNVSLLNQAADDLKKATIIDKDFYPAWFEWACTVTRIGMLNRDLNLFQKADQLFVKAKELCSDQEELIRADCYWRWGQCWYYNGKASGEISDFRTALEKFHFAADCGAEKKEFWNDYGNALVEHTYLLGQSNGFYNAIGLYKKALNDSPDYFEAWYNLASTHHHLFHLTAKETDFLQAHDCYERALNLESHHGVLWLKWANLLVMCGKMLKNEQHLLSSLERFERANECEPDHPHILRSWAEALLLCGVHADQFSLLKEAETKIVQSLEVEANEPLTWYLYGTCLNELGRYFEEDDYYIKAIEKFRHALKLNDKEPLLWYGLALSHYSLGEMRKDIKMLERADKFCMRVVEFGGKVAPQFWCDWGIVLLKLAEFTENIEYIEVAREKFEHALCTTDDEDQSSIEPEWLFHYASCLDSLGDFYEDGEIISEAIGYFKKILDADPENSIVRYHYALACSHLGEITSDIHAFFEALESFQILSEQDSEDEVASHDFGITFIHVAQLVYDPSRPEESQKYYNFAEKKLVHAASLGSTQAFYNLACLYSLCERNNLSMDYLEKAVRAHALPPLDDLLHDEWLDGVRETKEFARFLNDYKKLEDKKD